MNIISFFLLTQSFFHFFLHFEAKLGTFSRSNKAKYKFLKWLSWSSGFDGVSICVCGYSIATWRLLLLHHRSGSFWPSLSLGGPLSKHLSLQDLKLSPLLRLKKTKGKELFCSTHVYSTETSKPFSLDSAEGECYRQLLFPLAVIQELFSLFFPSQCEIKLLQCLGN